MESRDEIYIKMIVYLEKVLIRVENEILKKKLPKADTQRLLLLSLMLSIMETVKSFIVLLTNKVHIAIPLLLRNMLEAHVDLRNLILDPKYKDVMFTSYLVEHKRLLENQIEKNDIEKLMLEHINELMEIYKKNKKKTRLKSRFENVDLGEIYFSLYNRLCRETHNNVNCLIQRHFKHATETEELKYMDLKMNYEIAYYIDTCIDILHKSLVSIGQF